MKTLKLVIILTFLFLLFFSGCVLSVTVNQANPDIQDPSLLKLIAAGILGIYEIVVRIVPSVKDYSVVSFAINLLKKLSDSLNIKKNSP
jgi:hypothetical protein